MENYEYEIAKLQEKLESVQGVGHMLDMEEKLKGNETGIREYE
jgi:hypothetical protein